MTIPDCVRIGIDSIWDLILLCVGVFSIGAFALVALAAIGYFSVRGILFVADKLRSKP